MAAMVRYPAQVSELAGRQAPAAGPYKRHPQLGRQVCAWSQSEQEGRPVGLRPGSRWPGVHRLPTCMSRAGVFMADALRQAARQRARVGPAHVRPAHARPTGRLQAAPAHVTSLGRLAATRVTGSWEGRSPPHLPPLPAHLTTPHRLAATRLTGSWEGQVGPPSPLLEQLQQGACAAWCSHRQSVGRLPTACPEAAGSLGGLVQNEAV